MYEITLPFAGTTFAWRRIARQLMAARVAPELVSWVVATEEALPALPRDRYKVRVPERFLILSQIAGWHSAADRYDRLYRLAWRLRLTPAVIGDRADPEVSVLLEREADVLRSVRRLSRQLQLHELGRDSGRRQFAGWCDVPHDPLELLLPRYVRQLSEFDWTIYTPARVVRSRQGDLTVAASPERPDLPKDTRATEWQEWLRAQETPAPLDFAQAVGA